MGASIFTGDSVFRFLTSGSGESLTVVVVGTCCVKPLSGITLLFASETAASTRVLILFSFGLFCGRTVVGCVTRAAELEIGTGGTWTDETGIFSLETCAVSISALPCVVAGKLRAVTVACCFCAVTEDLSIDGPSGEGSCARLLCTPAAVTYCVAFTC